MWPTNRMGDSPAEALELLDSRVINVHLKDARRTGDGCELILLIHCDIPVKEGLPQLKQQGYGDFVSVE